MHNADSLTTVPYINRTNIQHAIFAVKKFISHVIVTLKRKTIIFQYLHSPSINHNHHFITSIRPQGDHQVLVAYPVRIFSKPSIRIDYHHINVLNNYSKQLYLNCPAQSPLYVVSIPAMEATALQECTQITSTLAHSLLSFYPR